MAGMFPLGLAYTEVAAYAKDAGHRSPEAFEEFVRLLFAMDAEFLAHAAEKQPST